MATFTCTWYNTEVPSNLKVKQVYGLVFTQDGRMLLKVEQKKGKKVYAPAGGTPEDFDVSREATLRREFVEEVNTTLKDQVFYVGYQEVNEDNGKNIFAQVRMTAIIDKIGPIKQDPDNGEVYERLLTSPQRAIELMNWGEIAKQQVEEAVKVAKQKLHITEFSDKEEWV